MSKPKLVPSAKSQIPGKAELTFQQWLGGLGKKIKTSLGATVFIVLSNVVYAGFSRLYPNFSAYALSDNELLAVSCSLQFVVVFVMILGWAFVRANHFDKASDNILEEEVKEECGYKNEDWATWELAKSDGEKALRHYEHYWMALLISWLILYALLSCLFLFGDLGQEAMLRLKIFLHFANNCATLGFLFCYFTLNQPESISSQGKPNNNETKWWLWVAILIVVTVVEAVCLALASKGWLNHFSPDSVSKVFGYISGISAAAVMAVYISRLSGRFLACPTWVLMLLYGYMAIQPLFAMFEEKTPAWGIVIIINFALVLKSLLYFFTIWLFEHNRLLFYFMRVRRLGDQVDAQMKNFSLVLKQ